MASKIFAGIQLPQGLIASADGALIQVIQEPMAEEAVEPFFGGYAEDFLADLGFDMVDDVAEKPLKAKRV